MIEARDFAALREVFREWPPPDVAEVILDLPEDEQVIIFRVLPHEIFSQDGVRARGIDWG